jgi:hypothetical protein
MKGNIIPPVNFAAERRKQARLDKLGTNTPRCVLCGEDDYRCLEGHHIAGRAYDPYTMIFCRNCHRKLSDMQTDHPKQKSTPPTREEIIGHFLLGVADIFELLIGKFREFAKWLLGDDPELASE